MHSSPSIIITVKAKEEEEEEDVEEEVENCPEKDHTVNLLGSSGQKQEQQKKNKKNQKTLWMMPAATSADIGNGNGNSSSECAACSLPILDRRYGQRCAGCDGNLEKEDLVRRARDKVFHIRCFQCSVCQRLLDTGDQVYASLGKIEITLLCPTCQLHLLTLSLSLSGLVAFTPHHHYLSLI
uniref:LIM zinc-binding domain-containing protein n=1 Tax=Caenorhabditis japonica TaxID=281687 RepID=A0A8R1E8Q1_CAEJA